MCRYVLPLFFFACQAVPQRYPTVTHLELIEQEDAEQVAAAADAATDALDSLRLQARAEPELRAAVTERASVDQGTPVYFVRLDELKAFTPGSDVRPLLHKLDTRVFEVKDESGVRSAMIMKREGSAWRTVSVGDHAFAEAASGARGAAERELGAATSTAIVRAPALQIAFVAHTVAHGLFLVPMNDGCGFVANQPMAAAAAFDSLHACALED